MIPAVIAQTIPADTPLRKFRDEAGWTLAELSDITGVSVAMLSLMERGLRRPSPRSRVAIARRLGVRVADLFAVEPILDEALKT